MKLCRIAHESLGKPRYAVLKGSRVYPLPVDYSFERVERFEEDSAFAVGEVRLLAPVAPSKIVCVGRNYREHAAELGNKMPDEPLLFLKAPSAIIASGDEIELPAASQQVEHEGELGVVIGRLARNITDDPLNYVFGYTCVNDEIGRAHV